MDLFSIFHHCSTVFQSNQISLFIYSDVNVHVNRAFTWNLLPEDGTVFPNVLWPLTMLQPKHPAVGCWAVFFSLRLWALINCCHTMENVRACQRSVKEKTKHMTSQGYVVSQKLNLKSNVTQLVLMITFCISWIFFMLRFLPSVIFLMSRLCYSSASIVTCWSFKNHFPALKMIHLIHLQFEHIFHLVIWNIRRKKTLDCYLVLETVMILRCNRFFIDLSFTLKQLIWD